MPTPSIRMSALAGLYGQLMDIINTTGVEWRDGVTPTKDGCDQLREARAIVDALLVLAKKPKVVRIIYDVPVPEPEPRGEE